MAGVHVLRHMAEDDATRAPMLKEPGLLQVRHSSRTNRRQRASSFSASSPFSFISDL